MKKSIHERNEKALLNSDVTGKILEEAVKFHGHLGPFLILGLKAGLFANKILGKDCFEVYTTVETQPYPPFSCVLDGIQIVTGCTMGKRNIKLRKGKHLMITFTRGKRRLKISLKGKVLSELKDMKSREESENKANILINQPFHELFNVEEQPATS